MDWRDYTKFQGSKNVWIEEDQSQPTKNFLYQSASISKASKSHSRNLDSSSLFDLFNFIRAVLPLSGKISGSFHIPHCMLNVDTTLFFFFWGGGRF